MEIDFYKNKRNTEFTSNKHVAKLYIRKWKRIGQSNNWSVPITPAQLEKRTCCQHVNRNRKHPKNNRESTEPDRLSCLAHKISCLGVERETRYFIFVHYSLNFVVLNLCQLGTETESRTRFTH